MKCKHDSGEIDTSAKKFAFLSKSTRNCKRLPSHSSQEQAYSMITRLVVCFFVTMQKMAQSTHRKMVVDCPLVITSKVKLFFQSRQDQERGMNGQASLLHS